MLGCIGIVLFIVLAIYGVMCLIGWIVYHIDRIRNTDIDHNSCATGNVTPRVRAPEPSCSVVGRRTKTGRSIHEVRRKTSVADDRGWQLKGNALRGYYQTKRGSFEGVIKQPFTKEPLFYIVKPKRDEVFRKKVLNGRHSACFRHKGRGVYWIHMSRKPALNGGILRIEHFIEESLS